MKFGEACDKEKETCDCGWGKCLRNDGMEASTCCSADYEFTCCTTTLLPEQKLEKACNDAAALCPCGWARCIKADGFKASLCCKEGYQYKCCVDPEKSYKMVKINTTENLLEQRAMNECKKATFTCFCSVMKYQNAWAVHFTCCDTNYTCKCCDTPKPAEHMQVKTECQGAMVNCPCGWGACVWQPGFSASGCCKDDYSFECCTKVNAFDLINCCWALKENQF
uniref:GRANULINS domain-containing protein n=1 Tax=Globodera pallida TaxID=36090 RepID=A0A183BZQ2_GLOPA